MKKLFLIAAAAAMVMVSCDKGPGTGSSEGDTRVVVKISGAQPSTRMVGGAAASNLTPTLETAYVYVIGTDDAVVFGEDLVVGDATGAGHMIGDGMLFSPDVRIFILGNWPSDVIPANLNSLADIEAKTSAVSNNVNYLKPAMSNYNTATKSSAPVAIVADVDAGTATVTVPISPLYSRLELGQIKGGAHVVSFKVAGVYVNNYYSDFTMTGVGKNIYNHVDGSTDFTGVMGDTAGWVAPASSPNTPDTAIAKPGATSVWAYHVGAGSAATFIIKMTDILILEVVKPADENGDGEELATVPTTPKKPGSTDDMTEAYITVTGYSDLSTGVFERGMIYTVTSLEFDHVQLAETPPVDPLVTIEAKVTINPWGTKTITPEIP